MFKTTVFKAIYTCLHIYIHIHAHMFEGGGIRKLSGLLSIKEQAEERASTLIWLFQQTSDFQD